MTFLDRLAPMAHWALRIALASIFLYHGKGKIPPTEFANAMGYPLIIGWLVMLAEIGCGVFVLLGGFLSDWMTRLGALFGVIIMVGAIALVHWPHGWSSQNGGMEFQVVLLLIGLYLLIMGNRVNHPGVPIAPAAGRVDTV